MPSDAECSFSSDSLDDRAIRDESSQRDSSTVISEFSSTKTLMNIGDDAKLPLDEGEIASKECLSSRRYSDPVVTEENAAEIRYSWQISQEKLNSTESNLELRLQQKELIEQHVESKYVSYTMPLKSRKNILAKSSMGSKKVKSGSAIEKSHATSVVESKRTSTSISRNIAEMRRQRRKQSVKLPSVPKQQSPTAIESAEYIAQRKIAGKSFASVESSCHEEQKANEAKVCEDCSLLGEISMSTSMKSKRRKIVLDFGEFPPPRHERRTQEPEFSQLSATTSPDNPKSEFYLSPIKKSGEAPSDRNKSDATGVAGKPIIKSTYTYRRKYHTYPKSRIPVAKYSKERRLENYPADPRMFPLEPREIDLESFQQLHTADSQEELQEFLLLESQCSGNLGLASDMSEATYDDHPSEDEGGSMSDY
ncbi:uncharacterized protein LOC105184336 [Harpegnathos saltator]|uniref:uncharacterized protein LOC105184336 n=1 Tax=Harpegnathos saltator TaxID=610380 RepID=UPI000948CAFE|nr:uncharacterized protein LOC105184336 [Harpegnathos saltator]